MRADTGEPLENATITVMQGAGPSRDFSPVTDSDGWFTFGGLPAGEWVLRALGPSGEMGEATVRVTVGSMARTTIKVR